MSDSRTLMISTLKEIVVPGLRELGFTGSFPHFRRISGDAIDLLSFQFDKWGGGFVIEISQCATSGIVTHWGELITANKVCAMDNHPDKRHRIKPGKEGSREDWFRYDQRSVLPKLNRYVQTARSVLTYLDEAESWWASESSDP